MCIRDRADGSVKFDSLPPGSYSLSASFSDQTPLARLGQKPLVAKHGEPTSFVVTAARAYKLSGRVVSSTDGKPVAEATIQVSTFKDGYMRFGSRTTTKLQVIDTDGKPALKARNAARRTSDL